MRIEFQTTSSTRTAAIVAALNNQIGLDDEQPAKKLDNKGRPFVSDGQISTALDALEERLKAGDKIPANPDHPERPFWKQIAASLGISASCLCAKQLSHRKRVLDLGDAYGLEPPPVEPKPLPFAEFSVIALAHRESELGSVGEDERAQQIASFATAMEKVAAECDPDEDARSALASAVAAIGVDGVVPSVGFLDEVKRAIAYLDRWDANEDLPLNPTHLLRYALCRSGLSERKAGVLAGVNQGSVHNWIRGRRGPLETQFKRVNRLEEVFLLPVDSVTSRFRAWRRLTRPTPVRGSTTYGKAAQWRLQFTYCMHDWPDRLESELAQWDDFRTNSLCPYGMKRPKGRLAAKTIQMHRDYLEMLFGSWTTDLNPNMRMERENVTMALLVFPRMLHERLRFALERTAFANGKDEPLLTKFEVDQIRWVKSLLDPETGWLTQMPQLATRLVPVVGLDGRAIVSEADIARAQADWKAACAAACDEYAHMKRSHLKHVARSRDPHESVRPILLLEKPLSALAELCRGLERDTQGLDLEPEAYACRDASLAGILCQTGFRMSTIEALNIEDLGFDESARVWRLRVPASKFKNGLGGPYFGQGTARRDHYERDLLDVHGLYAAIERYLTIGRSLILCGGNSNALFVVRPTERPGIRKQHYTWCEKGRMTTGYLGRLLHGVTGRHLRHNPEAGTGITGIISFPGHAFRHIIATGVLKQSVNNPVPHADPWQLAADAIHDGVRTVGAYVQYLPRDRQADLSTMLSLGLAN